MAILKRRKPRSPLKKLRESLWPSMGWRRTYHYHRHRLFRTGDSIYKITAGLATGAAVSFTPLVGTHFIQSIFFSWIIRANFLAAMIGTFWCNPWTFPFICVIDYKIGVWVYGLFGDSAFVALPADIQFDRVVADPGYFMSYLFEHPLKFLLPMTVGGYIAGILFWPVVYIVLYKPVQKIYTSYRARRMKRSFNKMKESDL